MNESVINNWSEKIHWTTGEKMLFSAQHKYLLELPEEFPFLIKFYKFTSVHPIIPNYHDFYEISCFFSGDAVYHIADKSFNVQSGSIVFIQSGQMHHMATNIATHNAKPLLSASIYFMPELIIQSTMNSLENDYLLPFLNSGVKRPPILHESDLGIAIWQFVLNMYQESVDSKDFFQLALKNSLCELLLLSLRTMKRLNLIEKKVQSSQNKIQRLTAVLDYIQRSYTESISLEQLAELAFMNSSYFCRYFKRIIGISPINYILRYRIEKAKELLVNSSLTITEVAFQVGFSSQSYFNRLFHKFTRMNPKNFRHQHAKVVYDKIE